MTLIHATIVIASAAVLMSTAAWAQPRPSHHGDHHRASPVLQSVANGSQGAELITQDKDTYRSLKEIHETIGTIGYYLIGAHAVAALLHHHLMRDNTLLRMLPARR